MAHRCRTVNSSVSDLTAFKSKLESWPSDTLEIQESQEEQSFFEIPLVYHVLFRVPYENLQSDFLEAQHKSLNADFGMRNPDLDRVQDQGPYAYALFKGNPRISFGSFSESQVRRLQLNRNQCPFRSLRDVLAFGGSAPVIGSINVYIAPLENILGEALRESFVCVCDTRVIGSREKPSGIANYCLGRTLTHQIAHCLSLQHPFGWPKGGPWPHPDIPKQIHPNYIARFLRLPDGTWTGTKDNKDLDDKKLSLLDPITDTRIPGPYSYNETYEMFFNFMDLAVDDVAVMFTKDQARQMRLYVKNSGKYNYVLRTADPQTQTQTEQTNETVINLSQQQQPGELAREPAHQPRSTSGSYMRALRVALRSMTPSSPPGISSLIVVAVVIFVIVGLTSILRRRQSQRNRTRKAALHY